jgi:4-carboxymuconolactone decarboxylase
MALDLGWSQRTDLRELAILAASLQFKSDYGFRSRLPNARAAGLTDEQLAALPEWQASALFDEEQKLTIAFAESVARGDVPPALFDQAKARWGERGAVECTALIGFWGFWAMFLNATGAELG